MNTFNTIHCASSDNSEYQILIRNCFLFKNIQKLNRHCVCMNNMRTQTLHMTINNQNLKTKKSGQSESFAVALVGPELVLLAYCCIWWCRQIAISTIPFYVLFWKRVPVSISILSSCLNVLECFFFFNFVFDSCYSITVTMNREWISFYLEKRDFQAMHFLSTFNIIWMHLHLSCMFHHKMKFNFDQLLQNTEIRPSIWFRNSWIRIGIEIVFFFFNLTIVDYEKQTICALVNRWKLTSPTCKFVNLCFCSTFSNFFKEYNVCDDVCQISYNIEQSTIYFSSLCVRIPYSPCTRCLIVSVVRCVWSFQWIWFESC